MYKESLSLSPSRHCTSDPNPANIIPVEMFVIFCLYSAIDLVLKFSLRNTDRQTEYKMKFKYNAALTPHPEYQGSMAVDCFESY